MRTGYEDMSIEQMRSLANIARINYQKSYSETYRSICLKHVTLIVQEMINREKMKTPIAPRYMTKCVLNTEDV